MNEENKSNSPWWQEVIFGLLMVAAAFWLYNYFVEFESSEDESRRMNWIFAIAYNLGGKWVASGLLAAMGLAMAGYAFIKRNEYD